MDNQLRNVSKSVFIIPAVRTLLFLISSIVLLYMPAFRGNNLSDVAIWWPILCIVVNIITVILLFYLMHKQGRKFRELLIINGRQTNVKEIFIALPIMVILGIGGLYGISFLIYGYMPLTTIHPLPLWAAIIVVILLPTTIVLSEIPFYLGYCIPEIRKITGSETFSIVYPLFFYALQHSFMPVLFDINHMLSRFLMFIPLLIMMGIWYNKKRTLIPLMAGHGFLDLLTGFQILIISVSPAVYDLMQSPV